MSEPRHEELANRIRSLIDCGDRDKGLETLNSFIGQKEQMLLALTGEKDELEQRLAQATRELRHSQQLLSDFDKLKNEFVSVCAHDLRSPTNSILSYLEILLTEGERLKKTERIDMLQRMDRAGRHMLTLISDLLDMVQIESGHLKYQPRPVFLSQLAREVVSGLQAGFDAKGIQAGLEVRKGELKVHMDEQKGLQILNNLISNAMKFTPKGGSVTVVIETLGKEVVTEVRDTGPGIPENEMALLFGKFSKLSTPATGGEKGTGLGLTIVKQLVELHKGTITVKSEVGKGCSFFVALPIAESPALLKLFGGRK